MQTDDFQSSNPCQKNGEQRGLNRFFYPADGAKTATPRNLPRTSLLMLVPLVVAISLAGCDRAPRTQIQPDFVANGGTNAASSSGGIGLTSNLTVKAGINQIVQQIERKYDEYRILKTNDDDFAKRDPETAHLMERLDEHPGNVMPTGDLGDVTKLIDIRGFLPVSFLVYNTNFRPFQQGVYNGAYYKEPIKCLSLFYYGYSANLYGVTASKNWDNVPVIEESQVADPEDEKWVRTTYQLLKDGNAEKLYKNVVGDDGFDGADPIAIFYTENSAFIVINFKWTGVLNGNGEGQTLVFYELSRRFNELKTVYRVYDRSLVHKSLVDINKQQCSAIFNALLKIEKNLPPFITGS